MQTKSKGEVKLALSLNILKNPLVTLNSQFSGNVLLVTTFE
jgi:hypothetical protein